MTASESGPGSRSGTKSESGSESESGQESGNTRICPICKSQGEPAEKPARGFLGHVMMAHDLSRSEAERAVESGGSLTPDELLSERDDLGPGIDAPGGEPQGELSQYVQSRIRRAADVSTAKRMLDDFEKDAENSGFDQKDIERAVNRAIRREMGGQSRVSSGDSDDTIATLLTDENVGKDEIDAYAKYNGRHPETIRAETELKKLDRRYEQRQQLVEGVFDGLQDLMKSQGGSIFGTALEKLLSSGDAEPERRAPRADWSEPVGREPPREERERPTNTGWDEPEPDPEPDRPERPRRPERPPGSAGGSPGTSDDGDDSDDGSAMQRKYQELVDTVESDADDSGHEQAESPPESGREPDRAEEPDAGDGDDTADADADTDDDSDGDGGAAPDALTDGGRDDQTDLPPNLIDWEGVEFEVPEWAGSLPSLAERYPTLEETADDDSREPVPDGGETVEPADLPAVYTVPPRSRFLAALADAGGDTDTRSLADTLGWPVTRVNFFAVRCDRVAEMVPTGVEEPTAVRLCDEFDPEAVLAALPDREPDDSSGEPIADGGWLTDIPTREERDRAALAAIRDLTDPQLRDLVDFRDLPASRQGDIRRSLPDVVTGPGGAAWQPARLESEAAAVLARRRARRREVQEQAETRAQSPLSALDGSVRIAGHDVPLWLLVGLAAVLAVWLLTRSGDSDGDGGGG